MNEMNELKAARQALIAERRARLGAPPTDEELVRYAHGLMSEQEEERIRELLVCYPELARAMAEPFPTGGAEPGHPDYLSDDVDQKPGAEVLPFRRRFTALPASLAAALILCFGGLLWQVQSNRQLREQLMQPRIASHEEPLLPDGARGPGTAATLSNDGDSYLLRVSLVGPADYFTYRLEIVEATDDDNGAVLWRSAELSRGNDDTFDVMVPRAFLKPGRYQIVLYGLQAGQADKPEKLATYTVRVAK